ncbi:hypothetical protein J6590_074296 [Homalodisca vitripennis]|nr:hypothetical protein J6590_074296 [Homalodisca vitripennis]
MLGSDIIYISKLHVSVHLGSGALDGLSLHRVMVDGEYPCDHHHCWFRNLCKPQCYTVLDSRELVRSLQKDGFNLEHQQAAFARKQATDVELEPAQSCNGLGGFVGDALASLATYRRGKIKKLLGRFLVHCVALRRLRYLLLSSAISGVH